MTLSLGLAGIPVTPSIMGFSMLHGVLRQTLRLRFCHGILYGDYS
jgi:hypothetical protein